jgi:hypothetical protein
VAIVNLRLQAVQRKADVNSDLQEEIVQTLELLKPLDTPQAPSVEGTVNFVVSSYRCVCMRM